MSKHRKDEKHTQLVNNLFKSIYKKYNLMNDVISLGSHRYFKRKAMKNCTNGNLLDLAAGTGDLVIYFRKLFGNDNKIVLADPNEEMLKYAKIRLAKKYLFDNIEYESAYAENLPFKDNSFDNISIGFGFRNFTDKEKSLLEIKRVLKKNGKLVIIDFSKPTNPLIKYFNSLYLKYIVPVVAKMITGNISEYQYLAKSISVHPSQTEIVKLIKSGGFRNCRYINNLNGIIAVHLAEK